MITLNGEEMTPTIFPDKTSQMWKLPEEILSTIHIFEIRWEFEAEREIFDVIGIVKILTSRSIPRERISLLIPYFPYGRQDKEVSNETTFNRAIFLDVLHLIRYNCMIHTIDPHSELPSWIGHSLGEYHIKKAIKEVGANMIVFPDEGAKLRYRDIGIDIDSIYGQKTRDQLTGHITDYKLSYMPNRSQIKVMIVDDICDGGRTFVLLAEALGKKGVKNINLYVSHGIFSKGLTDLRREGIKRIFTHKGEVK